ncbi:hypothetical protein FQA39_LY18526 [Lamprigera yunnana]|nr:hypothetical protein FQA39_LY18526 [Lamprigera yunnana]
MYRLTLNQVLCLNIPVFGNFNRNFPSILKKCNGLTTNAVRFVVPESKQGNDRILPFFDVINKRREQAKKSILVQVQSVESFKELYAYCSIYGKINQTFHYTTNVDQLHFIIVEFFEESHVINVMKNCMHLCDEGFPVCSNFLWFKASNSKSRLKLKKCKLNKENGNKIPTSNEISELLQIQNNVSEQILALHKITKLSEVATRLRFLTTRQVELSVAGMFPETIAYPFGSSVNGFGKMGCDLDIVLKLHTNNVINENRLVFHCKTLNSYERSVTQKHMEIMGDILKLFLPGCCQIRKILQARVPIIKYYQQFTDVECDLSMSNMSGVCMSDLLYFYGMIDSRVQPLVFVVRKWAQQVGVTSTSPGRWISNFSLTLLVLAFLQKLGTSSPILPSINTILKQNGDSCKSVSERQFEDSFLQNINIPNESQNTDNLETLLQNFFSFYSSFDFTTKAINLNEAIIMTKPEYSPLYIVNPLERGLNVSKNVSLEELQKFKYELRNASWLLESQDKNNSRWGILELLQNHKKSVSSNYITISKQDRLMEVSKLFDEENKPNVEEKFVKNNENHVKSFRYHKADR